MPAQWPLPATATLALHGRRHSNCHPLGTSRMKVLEDIKNLPVQPSHCKHAALLLLLELLLTRSQAMLLETSALSPAQAS